MKRIDAEEKATRSVLKALPWNSEQGEPPVCPAFHPVLPSVMKLRNDLEHKSHDKQLRNWGGSEWRKGGSGCLSTLYNSLKEDYGEVGVGLFSSK